MSVANRQMFSGKKISRSFAAMFYRGHFAIKRVKFPAAACLCCVITFFGCADLNRSLPDPASGAIQIHPKGWNDSLSASFHGIVLKSQHFDLNRCVTCHAKLFDGGTSGVRCFDCHKLYPHSAEFDTVSTALSFHGNFLLSGQAQLGECATCHGTMFDGGTSNSSCYTCHATYPHKPAWDSTSSAEFHGTYLQTKNWAPITCTPCHGIGYEGGSSHVSCYGCHKSYPHADDWFDFTVYPPIHANFIRTSYWDMLQCKLCHGSDYSGGRVGVSCLTCHGEPNGPENCTFCHGGSNPAPPFDLNGRTTPNAPGVGAHQAHVVGGNVGDSVRCSECHIVPTSVYSAGHIDSSGRAKISFGPLSRLRSEGGTFIPDPTYDFSSLQCANTFCHGNWRVLRSSSNYKFTYTDSMMTGLNYSPVWTSGPTEDFCGSCHGIPPSGHAPYGRSTCWQCHDGVVNPDGTIADKSKHINGKINVFGEEHSF